MPDGTCGLVRQDLEDGPPCTQSESTSPVTINQMTSNDEINEFAANGCDVSFKQLHASVQQVTVTNHPVPINQPSQSNPRSNAQTSCSVSSPCDGDNLNRCLDKLSPLPSTSGCGTKSRSHKQMESRILTSAPMKNYLQGQQEEWITRKDSF